MLRLFWVADLSTDRCERADPAALLLFVLACERGDPALLFFFLYWPLDTLRAAWTSVERLTDGVPAEGLMVRSAPEDAFVMIVPEKRVMRGCLS